MRFICFKLTTARKAFPLHRHSNVSKPTSNFYWYLGRRLYYVDVVNVSLYLQQLYSLDWRIGKPIDSRQHMETEDFKFPVGGRVY